MRADPTRRFRALTAEYLVYLSSFNSIKPAPSGQPDLIDEQDALRYLREECGMSMPDELEILPLFERTPLGLGSGHFFAMLRLVSWTQQGKSASKDLIFTQTKPCAHRSAQKVAHTSERIRSHLRKCPACHIARSEELDRRPFLAHHAVRPRRPKCLHQSPTLAPNSLLTPVREESSLNLNETDELSQAAQNKPPPAVPAKPQMPKVAPKPKVANPNIPLNLEDLQRKPMPIPPSSSANPSATEQPRHPTTSAVLAMRSP